MQQSILMLKIGGSVLTNKATPYSARYDAIQTIAKELKKIHTPLFISHGSGSFGHTSAKLYGGIHGYKSRWGVAKISRDAMEINRIVMDILVEEKIPAVSFRPMSCIVSKNGEVEETFFKSMLIALNQGLIPVIYGDIIWDEGWKSTICSGEKILNHICIYLLKKGFSISKIIQLTDVDGVFDHNGAIIPFINNNNWTHIKKYVNNTDTPDVTGGMKHKIENALQMAQTGINTTIINGNIPYQLDKVLRGDKLGTTVVY